MNPCPACRGRHPDDPPFRRICECGITWTSPRKDLPMSAAADFFKWREDWLQFVPVRNQHGGWDVHLVIDEGYGDLADALWHCDNYRHKIEQACTDDGKPLGVRLSPIRLRADATPPPVLPGSDPKDET